MDSVVKKQSFQPRPLAELLPELSGYSGFTVQKQPRNKIALTHTAVKDVQPLTIAQMRSELLALRKPSPRRFAQPTTSTKKKTWNSSVKLENKTKSHTADGQLKHNSVRKVLNFQSTNPRAKVLLKTTTSETPKFTKPDFRPKKSLLVQAKSTVRISGVFNMPETPVISNNLSKRRMTLANKENLAPKSNIRLKSEITPSLSKNRCTHPVPNTPVSNMSWKSDSDTSFLQKEREIQDVEDKVQALTEEPTLEAIAEVSPPVSTPFKEYRNVKDFFNHTNETDNSALYNDNTIMCFDKASLSKDKNKREESVIVSLCDLFNKASVTNADPPKTELNDLLEVEQQLEHNIKMVENGIKTLNNIKESQLQSLQYVKKLISDKKTQKVTGKENNNLLIKAKSMPKLDDEKFNCISPVSSKPCSVIKSPSYKVPKRNSCLRKKILHKSMPNVSDGLDTPNKDMNKRAFNMYMEMKMKDQMNFLNTPCSKNRPEVPDTPALTSHNLQIQLDKIYKDNT